MNYHIKKGGGAMTDKTGMNHKPNNLTNEKLPTNASVNYVTPDELYQKLLVSILRYHPSADLSGIDKAYKLASEAHEGQLRKSGEPYIIHPLCVATILAELELDKETIIASLLHDVIEDTDYTYDDIKEMFGEEVALLVDGVTKLTKLSWDMDKIEVQAENLRKMFLAMAKDIRVILIKLADRLHNMRTLKYMSEDKQKEIARETMDIYAPISQRLGISKVKIELDDLSLKYLEPEMYYNLAHKINLRKSERESFVDQIVEEVQEAMKKNDIEGEVDGRVKHFFSIYKKMKNQDKTLDQIYDLFAIRILVNTVNDCYSVLGMIHTMYRPIPGRVKDYIAMPKPNMYRSLHTTLIGHDGKLFEIQIRTFDMHKTAEYGIAAHWKYKEGKMGNQSETQEEEKMSWLRQILEWQREESDNKEFLNLIKSDLNLFSETVYCFTPQTDIKTLPAGSTPIDFAYSIHSAVGNKMVGAKVNDRMVTLDYVIKNGDRIEIITSQKSEGPSRDWLKIIKSTQARNKINAWFKQKSKDEDIQRGKELIDHYAKAKSYVLSDLLKPTYMNLVLKKYGFKDWDSLLAAIGHGGLKEGQIVNKLVEEYDKVNKKTILDSDELDNIQTQAEKKKPKRHAAKSGVIIQGYDDLEIRYKRCCSPLPGDSIVGFITRGRGVAIHRADCVNITTLPEHEKARLIDVEWQIDSVETYPVEIRIFVSNRKGLIVDLSKLFTESSIDILSMNSRVNKKGIATIDIGFEADSVQTMNQMIEKVRGISGVLNITRNVG